MSAQSALWINRVTGTLPVQTHESKEEAWAFEDITAFFLGIYTRISVVIQLKHRPHFLFELFSFFF